MIDKMKSFVRRHRLLRTILYIFCFKRVFSDLRYRYKTAKNVPFKYRLPDGDFIRLFPQGQIAKPLYHGCFEQDDVKLFLSLLKPGMHVVDVGANIGFYSIIACKALRGKGKILAFEPSSQNYERLLKNLSLNGCRDIVTPFNLGLGNKDDEELFLRRDGGYGDAERYVLPENKLPNEDLPNVKEQAESEKINLTTLDAVIEEMRSFKVDFMKMDTEGYEYFALQGARKTLASNPNMILMIECTELGTKRAGHTQQDVYDILNEFGFRCFYWNSEKRVWGKDKESLLKAGNIWACRNEEQLSSCFMRVNE